MRIPLFFSLLLLLTSCATNLPQANRYNLSNEDKLPPITLAVSAGRYVTDVQAETVEHIAKSVQNSGLFSAVETNFARHPLVLLIAYKCDIPNDTANFANTMLSAATLFVVPSSLKKIHTIEVEFVLGKNTLFKKTYTQEHSVTMSLYTPPGHQHLAGVNLVINQFLDDIKTNRVLPSMADFPQPSVEQQDKTI
jgi:hypothetical protein